MFADKVLSPLTFSQKEQREIEMKGNPCAEPRTRATKQTFLFPPSNKGAGTTRPNYISATHHGRYRQVAKTKHIQTLAPSCHTASPFASPGKGKGSPRSNRCWVSPTRPQFSVEQGCFIKHVMFLKFEVLSSLPA